MGDNASRRRLECPDWTGDTWQDNGYGGDGGPATAALFRGPWDVALDADGALFVSDLFNNRIRKIQQDGIISTIGGNGGEIPSGDGGMAIAAGIPGPRAIAFAPDGALLIYAYGNDRRVRRVAADGSISTFAGGGSELGDGGPATKALLDYVPHICFDRHGNLLIADYRGNRLRSVSTTGEISTLAGDGIRVPPDGLFKGDGGPAAKARVNSPISLAVSDVGEVFIGEGADNFDIRKIDREGVITTFAARVNALALAIDPAGNLLASVRGQILRFDASGKATTIAGSGKCCFSGDGGYAVSADLNYVTGLAVAKDGSIFLADAYANRIRKLTPVKR